MGKKALPPMVSAILAAIGSVLLFHLSVMGAFFLLPLAWVNRRLGKAFFLTASLLAISGYAGATVLLKALEKAPWSVWDSLDVGFPAFLALGWTAIVFLETLGWRFLYRVSVVTVVSSAVCFPLVAYFVADPAVTKAWKDGFELIWTQVAQAGGNDAAAALTPGNKEQFFEMVKESTLGGFLPVLFLFWGVTERISRGLDLQTRDVPRWEQFRLPAEGVIPFLGVWGLILVKGLLQNLGTDWDLGVAWYFVENFAAVTWLIYALAGWGVLQAIFSRIHLGKGVRWILGLLLILSVFGGGPASLLVIVGLPLLAVLELWIDFRKKEQRG